MKIARFGVETWMNRYETECRWNLAETCVESLTLAELLALGGGADEVVASLLPLQLTYGAIEGSAQLRGLIAGLYDRQAAENVLVTHGAIGANMLVHRTLVEPGDRVVAVLPTYQQHYSIPESCGADVRVLRLTEDRDFLPDLDALASLAEPPTKLIAVANPNNPTGALMDRASLERVAAIARAAGAWVLCDEVYRGTDEDGSGFTASMADVYEQGISTGSMSKTYSLAGLRLGWIAGPRPLLDAVIVHRDYDTISVGMLDDRLASLALEHRKALLARTRAITRRNRAVLDEWVAGEPSVSWIRPRSGTTALLKYDLPMTSEALCVALLEEQGVLLTPGSAMEMEGYLRIGYATGDDTLRRGLTHLSAFLSRQKASEF